MLKKQGEKLSVILDFLSVMIWHIIRYWTSLLIPIFYKRIQGKNVERLQVKGPVIIAMNHPNAFADPVVFTMACFPPRLNYMARGDAFKPGLITWLLEQIGIVPIFRIQDGGREGLKKNDEAYRRVNALLKKNAKVIIFAEGLCVQERRLRPLKKGVARMVFGAYEFLNNDKLLVVPVGVNYSKPDKFRSNVFYNVGEPIPVKEFIEDYRKNPARAQSAFLTHLEPRMKELITHINEPANDVAVYMLEQLCKKDWMKEQGLAHRNLDHQLTVQKQITARVNAASNLRNPALETFKEKGKIYFETLHRNGLRDWLINPKQNKWVNAPLLGIRVLLLMLGLPIYLVGLLGNLPQLFITDRVTRKLVKKPEFYASFAIGVGMVVFLAFYLVWFFTAYAFAETVFPAWITIVGFMLSGVFCLQYHPFLLKTIGIFKILKNRTLANKLAAMRQEVMNELNKF